MRLNEITDDREPLLISTMRKLLTKGDRIWLKGAFSLVEMRKIVTAIVDQPRGLDQDEYHGIAWKIDVYGGVGMSLTPDDAETKWTLVKRDRPSSVQHWELQRVRNG